MKRVLLQNVWIRTGINEYLLMNLFTYRRKKIDECHLELLAIIDDKLQQKLELCNAERHFYNQLVEECQVFDDSTIKEIDAHREDAFNKIVPRGAITTITINLTYDCNFKCNYCYQRDFDMRNCNISVDDVNSIKDFLLEYHRQINQPLHLNNVVLSGGESLLEKNIPVIQHIFKTFPESKFKLFTNGVNLKKYFHTLPISRFSEIQLSLDGNEDIIQKTNNHNGNVFNDIIDGARLALESGIAVTIATMLTSLTVENFDKFLERLRESKILEFEKASLQILTARKRTVNTVLDSEIYDDKSYLLQIQKMQEKIMGTRIILHKLYDFKNLSATLFRPANVRYDYIDRPCNIVDSFGVVFAPDGKIYWCGCAKPNNGTIGTFSPKIDINFDAIKKFFYRGPYTMIKCRKCDFRYVCNGGCPLNALGTHDDINTPYCGAFENEFFMENLEYFI